MNTYMKFKGGKSRALTFSYDDATVQDIRLMEIFNRYGLKATFNINTGCYLPEDAVREKYDGRLKFSEAKELYTNCGHEIAVHSLTHPTLSMLTGPEIIYEIIEDRKNIENTFGTITRGMAYPNGPYNERVIEAARECGIVYARTINATENFKLPENWLELHPTCHHRHPKLMEFADKFLEEPDNSSTLRLFFVWGHSFNFDREDNWEVIEEFGKKVGGRDNVWYATNIEIYEYVEAYKSLRRSVDGKTIYNPTQIEVWALDKNGLYSIKPGETVVR